MATKKRSPFESARAAESEYSRDLVAVAREIGKIIKRYGVFDPSKFPPLREALTKYGEILKPWAKLRAERFVTQVDKKSKRAWATASENISKELKNVIRNTDVGATFTELVNEQVSLIQSLPREAAERVQRLAIENVEKGGRSTELMDEILRSGDVAASRAKTIARTETSRAASTLSQVRAEGVGSEGYTWRTARDGDVRDSHRKMEGKFVRWDSPPTLDGMTGHAGCLPNCRCYAEPVIPRNLFDE